MEIVVLHSKSGLNLNQDVFKTNFNGHFQFHFADGFVQSPLLSHTDFLILYMSHPDEDDIDLNIIKHIKAIKNIPVLTIIPKNDYLFSKAFFYGSDEVLYTPFSSEEFTIRCTILIDRFMHLMHQSQIKIQDLVINPHKYEIRRGKMFLNLTKLEFDILKLLVLHPNKVFLKKELYENIWQEGYYGNANVLNVHIRRLRKKIEIDPNDPKIIQTVWGVGYKIVQF